jgi:hypothetical protein
MTSATEPLRKASTGVPHAIASIMTRPNGSGRRSGTARRARLAEEFALGGLVDLTDEFNAGPVEQRLDPYAEILLVDLGRNLERDAESARDSNRRLDPFFRRNAAEESEIAAARVEGGLEQIDRQPVIDCRQKVRIRNGRALRIRDRYERHFRKSGVERLQVRAWRPCNVVTVRPAIDRNIGNWNWSIWK